MSEADKMLNNNKPAGAENAAPAGDKANAPAASEGALAGGMPPIAVRMMRNKTALSLHEPDRVPFMPSMNNFYALHYGVTVEESMTDARSLIEPLKRFCEDYNPDWVWNPVPFPIKPMETIGHKQARFPGKYYNLPANTPYQYVDKSYLSEDDYDEYFEDPTKYVINKVLPNKYSGLEGLKNLDIDKSILEGYDKVLWEADPTGFALHVAIPAKYPELDGLKYINPFAITGHCILSNMQFANPAAAAALKAAMNKVDPASAAAFKTLLQVADETFSYMQGGIELTMSIINNGYPVYGGSPACIPFDDFADSIRGLMDLCMDVVTDPDLVDEAIQKLGDISIPAAIRNAKMSHCEDLFLPLHCGVENFMSIQNYEEHYWPCLKRTIMAAIEADLTPIVFCEGKYTNRLECLTDVPAGKVLYAFEDVDLEKAKKILTGHAAIGAGMNTHTLMFGTPEQVEDEVKRNMDLLAPGGGFFSMNSIALDEVSPENMHAWRNAVEKYGYYK